MAWSAVIIPMYIIGDIHGHLDRAVALLETAGLISDNRSWSGGRETLWFIGDYFDAGPDGAGTVELIMRLQEGAAAAGGRVGALLGNHEALILALLTFGDQRIGLSRLSPRAKWRDADGQESDLQRLTPDHITWLRQLPAMALEDGYLLAHADSLFYQNYGLTVAAVNEVIRWILEGDDSDAWEELLDFGERYAFWGGKAASKRAATFLATFGGRQFIHGHTPISKVTGQEPQLVSEPLRYANGLCLNIDHGLYLGGRGFITKLEAIQASQV
jgi:hypothetical protein